MTYIKEISLGVGVNVSRHIQRSPNTRIESQSWIHTHTKLV